MILTVFSLKPVNSAELAGYALKKYAELAGENYPPAEYRHRADGSPYFDCENAPFVSVSHSGEYVAAAVSDSAVGIDVQIHTDADHEKISARFKMDAVGKEDFFDRFAAAEAKTKALRIPLPQSLCTPEGRIFRFVPRCSMAIYGTGEIFFTFRFDD